MFIKDHDAIAMIFRDNKITYKELITNIKKISGLLNLERESRVILFFENRPEWAYTFFANLNLGCINVLVDALSIPEDVAYIIDDCKPIKAVISDKTEETFKKALEISNHKLDYINIDKVNLTTLAEYEKEYENKEDDIAAILYTSGTTGKPKGVMLTYGNFMAEIEGINQLKIIKKGESNLLLLPLHHSYPLTATLLVPLYNGATVVFVEKLVSEEILGALQKYKVNIIAGVPRLYELFHKSIMSKINAKLITRLLFKLAKKINSLTFSRILFKKVHNVFGGHITLLISGGAKLNEDVAKDFTALGFKISEGYGLTETAPIIAFQGKYGIKIGSCGRPLSINEVKIVNNEIVVKGRNVMKGYYNKPEETNAVLKDGWFYTGDAGYLDKDGYLYITGRIKDIIVLPNGKNITPDEIEHKIILSTDKIKEIAIAQIDNHLHAFVYPDYSKVNNTEANKVVEGIINDYNNSVPEYKRILGITILDTELPKTRIGKVKRFELPSLLNKKREEIKEVKEPDTEEYRIIKKFLENYYKRQIHFKMHIDFDLQMDSLDKTEFRYFLEKKFNFKAPIEEWNKYLTIEELYNFVIKNKKGFIEEDKVNWTEILKDEFLIKFNKSHNLMKILRFILRPIIYKYFKIEVEGLENVNTNLNYLITPNHQSHLDAFVLSAVLPYSILKETYFFAKAKHFKSPIRRWFADRCNVIIMDINTNLLDSLRATVSTLRRGKNTVYFPEGTRSKTGELQEFKKTFAILAKEAKVNILPVVIKGTYDSMPPGSKFPRSAKVKIKFLPAVMVEDKTVDEIYEETKEKIKKGFAE